MKEQYKNLVNFIFEVGILSHFKRSGFDFLGSCNQNISSHIFRTSIIGYMLASLNNNADAYKTAILCLFHDIPETRTGDINMFQKNYVTKDENKAAFDIFKNFKESKSFTCLIEEFNTGNSIEAIYARDADILELIFTLKEELDKGNNQAKYWIDHAIKRLDSNEAKEVSKQVLSTNFYDWWQKQ